MSTLKRLPCYAELPPDDVESMSDDNNGVTTIRLRHRRALSTGVVIPARTIGHLIDIGGELYSKTTHSCCLL